MAEPGTQRSEFFPGFATEQINTSDATINTVYGGNRNSSPLLLLHGIPETHCALAQSGAEFGAKLLCRHDRFARLMGTAASHPEARITSRTRNGPWRKIKLK
jgi:hypothetical protein